MDLAIQLDQNQMADEAFHASICSAPTQNPSILCHPTFKVRKALPPAPPAHFAHLSPTPGKPVPMDVDAARRKGNLLLLCQRCGKPGHFAKDCELRYDVRLMMVDDLQTILEDMLAAKDAIPTESLEKPEEGEEEEDFVHSSE